VFSEPRLSQETVVNVRIRWVNHPYGSKASFLVNGPAGSPNDTRFSRILVEFD